MPALRWTARVLSAVLLLFLGLSLAGSLGHETLQPGDAAKLARLAVMMAGMVIAWRWELLGGSLVVGSVLVTVTRAGGTPLDMMMRSPFVVVGLLFIASGITSAAAKKRQSP